MKLFGIPDIRLFWSEDPRCLSQFSNTKGVSKFTPFSKYPPSYKDVSFWLNNNDFVSNDLFEICRSEAGDCIEEMTPVDSFENPKTGRMSHCYRITYRAMDRTLVDDEVNLIQDRIRARISSELNVE